MEQLARALPWYPVLMRWVLSRLLVVGVIMGAAMPAARADAISPPPACPPGSQGRSSHAGEWCEPAACQSDSDCSKLGGSCRPWRVCTRAAKAQHGGLRGFDRPPMDVTLAVGSCAPDEACRGDEEPPPPTIGSWAEGPPVCTNATYCVPASLPPLPTAAGPSSAAPSGSADAGGCAPPPAGRPRGCGCRVGAPTDPLVGLGALVVAVGVAGYARRRRKTP